MAALLVLAGPACAPIVVATAGFGVLQSGTAAFINGELESAQIAPLDTVYECTLLALNDLQFKVISQRKGASSASFHAREEHGRSITIDLSAKGSESTLKDNPFKIKEGSKFTMIAKFKVQHEVLSGLQYVQIVRRKGIRVSKDQEMIVSDPQLRRTICSTHSLKLCKNHGAG